MTGDPDSEGASDAQRATYAAAVSKADAAFEAVGDAEDAIVDAETARDERPPPVAAGDSAADERRVEDAEAEWHERRHEAHAATQARDDARRDLDDEPDESAP